MKPYILQHKIARIIAALGAKLGISQPEALIVFYQSKTGSKLHKPETGLYLMSDNYILDDLLSEVM